VYGYIGWTHGRRSLRGALFFQQLIGFCVSYPGERREHTFPLSSSARDSPHDTYCKKLWSQARDLRCLPGLWQGDAE
jgi:hypothetical protein